MVSHWLTPTVFVSVSRSNRLACASCLWLILESSGKINVFYWLLCPWNKISSFLSLSFSNKDLFLSSRAVDLPTLLLLYRSEFLFILLFTFLLVCGFYFPLCFHFPLPRDRAFLTPCSKKSILFRNSGRYVWESWSHHEFFYLSRSRHSLASREEAKQPTHILPKPRLGGNSATAKSTGSGSSGKK